MHLKSDTEHNSTKVRKMTETDIPRAAAVYARAVDEQPSFAQWLECALNSYPKSQIFVADQNDNILGFIMWTEKSGFRKGAFLELEQIVVHPAHQRKGIGTRLIKDSLPRLASKIAQRGACLKTIMIKTQPGNKVFTCKNGFG